LVRFSQKHFSILQLAGFKSIDSSLRLTQNSCTRFPKGRRIAVTPKEFPALNSWSKALNRR
jgi:hypothetical protein